MSTNTKPLKTYRQALHECMDYALENHANTVIFGQGVDDFRGTFGTTAGLAEKYGAERVMDTPLSEDAMTGICIGAALGGLRPIHIHIRADFLFLALNQIFNMASKYRYMFGGHYEVPVFIRAMIGRSWGQGAQHSQSPQSILSHFPGLKVIMPATSQAILEMYKQVIDHSTGPVISLEHRLLYDIQFETEPDKLPESDCLSANVVHPGDDITIVASSIMVLEAIRTAKYLSQYGIRCEVIDIRSPSHIHWQTIKDSLTKTGRLLVADTSWLAYGFAAEIGRLVATDEVGLLKQPMHALGMKPSPCPTAKTLEDMFYPSQQEMVETITTMLSVDKGAVPIPDERSMVDLYKKFKGPF